MSQSQEKQKGYRLEEEGTDEKTFACSTCDYKNKKETYMKSHITKIHVKKQVQKTAERVEDEGEIDEIDEIDEADLAALEEWDRPRGSVVEDVDEEDDDEVSLSVENVVVVINDATGQEGNLVKAVERIKSLEEELGVKEEVLRKLETELETARDLAKIADGTVRSMQTENENLKTKVNKYQRIGLNQKDDLNKMRAGGADPEIEGKLKLVQEELKKKTKAVEALEKTKKELAKKVEEEVSARAKAEADCAKFSKMVDILQDTNSKEKSKTKPKVVCRDVNKAGGCPRAGNCTFLHPALAKENKGIDCHHWMSGHCKFTEKTCKFKHDITKKAVNETKRKRSEDEEQVKESGQQDFLLSLVRAFAQGSAGEARLGEPARGLEGHRNTRPRMVSPESSARGLEGQQRSSRNYASTVDSRHRRESRGSYCSPSRGLEEQGPVELMRRLVRPAQSAGQVDKLQEGIQLLMQIAQQGGRM
jgi:hypothetical protein